MHNFITQWRSWYKLLDTLVTNSGGHLICPDERQLQVNKSNATTTVTLPHPICFYGIPQKQRSVQNSKRGKLMVIFIDGSFCFDANNTSVLNDISSSVSFYLISGAEDKKLLTLADAYHFDYFKENVNGASPHPMFHAQREIRLEDMLPRFKNALEHVRWKSKGEIFEPTQEEVNELFGFGSFRIPTPQMDLLNLGAAIAANQLVSSDDLRQWAILKQLLTQTKASNEQFSIRTPLSHNAEILNIPRKHLPDWYSAR
jgi:hypothetical protein